MHHAPILWIFRLAVGTSHFWSCSMATPEMMPRIASNAEVYGQVAQGPLAGVPIAGEVLPELRDAFIGKQTESTVNT